MNSINAIEQVQQLPEPQEITREAALKRMEMLRGKIIVGDIFAPFDDS